VVYVPRRQLEYNIGRFRLPNGWVQSAYATPGTRPCIIVIADDVPASARRLLIEHEAAHCAGWPQAHPGELLPPNHDVACQASRLAPADMQALCYLEDSPELRAALAQRL
jgi:hypothetical protein